MRSSVFLPFFTKPFVPPQKVAVHWLWTVKARDSVYGSHIGCLDASMVCMAATTFVRATRLYGYPGRVQAAI